MGMKLCLADLRQDALDQAAAELTGARVIKVPVDVSRMEEVQCLKERVYAEFGEVAVLMNNAGTSPGGGPWDHYERWQQVLGVNLWGVINGVHAFTQAMIDQQTPCAIVNTGSKQGITCPPGDTAYNITKAGVKVLTEGLQHSLRNIEGCQVTAHLLVPGSTFTGMTARGRTEKPPGSWTPDQVIDVLVERMGNGDFYIICPDNDVTTDIGWHQLYRHVDRLRPQRGAYWPLNRASARQLLSGKQMRVLGRGSARSSGRAQSPCLYPRQYHRGGRAEPPAHEDRLSRSRAVSHLSVAPDPRRERRARRAARVAGCPKASVHWHVRHPAKPA